MNYSLNVEAKTSQTSPLSSALSGHNRLKSILNGAVVQLALVGLALTCSLTTWGQQSAVVSESVGSRVFMEVSTIGLRSDLDTLYARVANLGPAVGASSSLTWSDVLTNGGNPGMDINFSSYDITGLGGLTSTGTLAADSLTLNKDADITGRLSVTDVVNFNDSLTVTGYVEFSDSLEVVKAVSVGETLYVTGVTSLGDSLHVVGNVDLDALFNVDGAATFGSTLTVAGQTILNDSLHVNSGARIVGTLYADSAVVEDVINGQVSSLSNHSTDGLGEGSTNLYFTEQRAIEALSDTLAYLLQLIADLQNGASDAPGTAPFTCGTSTVTYDSHDYATVQIGEQCWFAENLRSTKYNDEAVIPSGLDATEWSNTEDGAMTIYDEDGANEATNLETYGRLYNWYAVNTGKLCPSGWHVPTDAEWVTLTDHLGGGLAAGDEMKSTSGWSSDGNGTNSSGFSGLPGGSRDNVGTFGNVGSNGAWWSSSPNSDNAWSRKLLGFFGGVNRSIAGHPLQNGFSARCLSDAAVASSASVPVVSSSESTDLAETTATLNGAVDADGGDAVTATGFVWGTDALLSGASDASGSATSGAFSASLTGLTGGTTYYFSAYATNGEGTDYGDTLSFTTTSATASFTCGTSTVTFDGHDYSTVEIGAQCWFAENLRSTQYADGSSIAEVTDNSVWISTNDGARAAYNNDASNVTTYGYLYNWYAVDNSSGLCPTDWHVPTDEEWTALTTELGGESVAGGKMKSSSTDSPSWNGNNSNGFSALPGGLRYDSNGYFNNEGSSGYWWSASPDGTSDAWYRRLGYAYDSVAQSSYGQRGGFSVRCLRDE